MIKQKKKTDEQISRQFNIKLSVVEEKRTFIEEAGKYLSQDEKDYIMKNKHEHVEYICNNLKKP